MNVGQPNNQNNYSRDGKIMKTNYGDQATLTYKIIKIMTKTSKDWSSEYEIINITSDSPEVHI